MKVQKKIYLWSTALGELVKETCKTLIKHKDIMKLMSYCEEIKLKKSDCQKCKVITPTLVCESYTICTLCFKDKEI